MCGVVGYIGQREAHEVLLTNMGYLQQRGYDSAGVAVMDSDKAVHVQKAIKEESGPSPVSQLWNQHGKASLLGGIGIGHTRWGTHGEVSIYNAHPHMNPDSNIWMVHNGIIDNAAELKAEFFPGASFLSETDSEVIVHLVSMYCDEGLSLADALKKALSHVSGTYALILMSTKEPNKLVCARLGSPLMVGVTESEMFVASDEEGLASYTNRVVDLKEMMPDGGVTVVNLNGVHGGDSPERTIPWDISMAQKGEYPHFMLKEIMDQPRVAVLATSEGRRLDFKNVTTRLDGPKAFARELARIEDVFLVGCGTAYHAALLGERFLREDASLRRARAVIASETSLEQMVVDPHKTLVIAVSQSGTTYDTRCVVEDAQRMGALTCGIINRVESEIARLCDFGVYCHAGPEISVASTKAFLSQGLVLYQLAIFLEGLSDFGGNYSDGYLDELHTFSKKVENALLVRDQVARIANFLFRGALSRPRFVQFIGCGASAVAAMEGALKFKEVTYIPSSGMPGGELKHGALAVLGPDTPAVIIMPECDEQTPIASTLAQLQKTGCPRIVVTTEGQKTFNLEGVDEVIHVPKTDHQLQAMLSVIPLQLLAYETAVALELDVDMPRHLAKTVTVA